MSTRNLTDLPPPTSPRVRHQPGASAGRAFIRLTACALALSLLAACSILGPVDPKDAVARYSLDPRVQADPAWPQADWQLSLADLDAAPAVDSLRILVRPQPNEVQVYQGARWAKLPSSMVLDGVLRALEDSGRIRAVARQGSGIGADYKLVMDLRRFESEYADGAALPSAVIEVSAKLLHVPDQQVVASRTFLQSQPAGAPAVVDVAAAFEQALAANSRDIAGWVLVSGNAHEHDAHP
ncbi:ABC-type transport auxiliary lipoprotein family protein [Marilutibacter chinensis]|uniref:ABC-type transport auxiliary lipoprotein family protein n=1 Tax=Marilutibacter chinensis TaxID=2912247 RepID=A0ABS9HQT2_9GAMM|nr:ABC-type transport auxiliary lipoprotein family protein [Lysobacter chinensis]MCF7221296.1 ABC-type transport auxiliary lipoprotein family protein [Lysobacter chinensis]